MHSKLLLFVICVAFFSLPWPGSADSQIGSAQPIYSSVIKSEIKDINESGHPIFIGGCTQGVTRYLLVIANPLAEGIFLILRGNKILNMSAVHESAIRSKFYVENVNSSGQTDAKSDLIVADLARSPFFMLDSLNYEQLLQYTPKVACHLPKTLQ